MNYSDIEEAAQRLAGVAQRTPVLSSTYLNEKLNAEIYFKCENFQRVGAFKFRGAYNAISQLKNSIASQGVLAYSSGNHAQAVALSCKLLGIPATILMPSNASNIKREATEARGARVVGYDPQTQSRETQAEELLNKGAYTLVKPFDDERVIAGQATAALELLEEISGLGYILAPCGGGGLLSGTAIAAKTKQTSCKVIGIEPELADDATRSFQSGTLQSIKYSSTIADGTRTQCLGDITFPLIQEYVDDFQTVSETAIAEAVRLLFQYLKIVVEPSGALGLAALLEGRFNPKEKIGIIVSGGNVDAETFANILLGKIPSA